MLLTGVIACTIMHRYYIIIKNKQVIEQINIICSYYTV